MERRATYTVEVPIRFTYCADNNLSGAELLDSARKELLKRLENGYFDICYEKTEVVDKVTHYSQQEKKDREKAMFIFIRG